MTGSSEADPESSTETGKKLAVRVFIRVAEQCTATLKTQVHGYITPLFALAYVLRTLPRIKKVWGVLTKTLQYGVRTLSILLTLPIFTAVENS